METDNFCAAFDSFKGLFFKCPTLRPKFPRFVSDLTFNCSCIRHQLFLMAPHFLHVLRGKMWKKIHTSNDSIVCWRSGTGRKWNVPLLAIRYAASRPHADAASWASEETGAEAGVCLWYAGSISRTKVIVNWGATGTVNLKTNGVLKIICTYWLSGRAGRENI